jgi:hypothetical protein
MQRHNIFDLLSSTRTAAHQVPAEQESLQEISFTIRSKILI